MKTFTKNKNNLTFITHGAFILTMYGLAGLSFREDTFLLEFKQTPNELVAILAIYVINLVFAYRSSHNKGLAVDILYYISSFFSMMWVCAIYLNGRVGGWSKSVLSDNIFNIFDVYLNTLPLFLLSFIIGSALFFGITIVVGQILINAMARDDSFEDNKTNSVSEEL